MKFTTAAAIATGAVVVSAQLPALPSTIPILGLPFGQQCQQTVLGLFTNGSFSQCFPAPALLPLLTGGNDSIIPTLDNFMTELCYNEPCSNDTLTQAAQQIEQGCASDLQASNISNSVIDTIFSVYPVLREVLCLKTTDYYTEESYGGFLGSAPIPISDAYNLTDGAFCVSSVLTQLSAYVDANLTIPYIAGAVTGSNSTAQDLFKEIQPNFICNGCIFGAVDVVAAAYPFIANVTVGEALAYANMTSVLQSSTIPADATLPDLMDGECAYVPLAVNTTQLPPGVSISIVNNTAPNAPADGEAIQDDTPTPSEPESPIPEGSAPAGVPDASAAPVAPAPVDPSASAPAAPSVASSAAPSLPAVDPSATPAAPSASA